MIAAGAPDRDHPTGSAGPADDRGVATVIAAVVVAGLLAVAVAGIYLGTAAVTRRRAEAAADLAALAAASRADTGVVQACGRARQVAEQMRVRISACRFDGWDALVEVEAAPPRVLAPLGSVNARARAGPAERAGPETAVNGHRWTMNGPTRAPPLR